MTYDGDPCAMTDAQIRSAIEELDIDQDIGLAPANYHALRDALVKERNIRDYEDSLTPEDYYYEGFDAGEGF